MDSLVIHLRINQGESDAMEENSMKKIMIIIGIAIALPVLSGCNTLQKQTLVDKNWGRSYETARFSQIINPEAGKTRTAVQQPTTKVCTGQQGRFARLRW